MGAEGSAVGALTTCQKPDRKGGQDELPHALSKVDYIDFQSRTQPLAFLITFRCYGTFAYVNNGQGDEPFR